MNAPSAALTVVIPCRNMAAYLARAVESALNQVPSPRELIVVDDKSTDGSRDVAASFGNAVTLLDGPGQGSAVARNIGILAGTQPFVAFLDADDYWLPGKLEAQLSRLSDARFDACFTDWFQVEDPARLGAPVFAQTYPMVREGEIFGPLLEGNFILTSSIVIRRSALAKSGIFNRDLRGSQDYELWLRLARIALFAWETRPLAVKVEHANNISAGREYPFLRARAYQAIYDTHWESATEHERLLLDRMAGEAHFDAGRHALRNSDFGRARRYLAEACSPKWGRASYYKWYAVSRLPNAVLSWLISIKRQLKQS